MESRQISTSASDQDRAERMIPGATGPACALRGQYTRDCMKHHAKRTDPCVKLAGFTIERHTTPTLMAWVIDRVNARSGLALFFANSNFVVMCHELRQEIASESSCLIVNDGIGVDIGASMTGQRPFAENLNGTDFVPALLRSIPPIKVLIYGAKPESLAGARDEITRMGHDVVAAFDGYTTDQASLVQAMENHRPALVLVGLGNPRQEAWILKQMPAFKDVAFIGVGALFDFLSHTIPRAPSWVRQVRMEWLYRLVHEPRRLLKRYTWDFGRFLWMCLRGH